MWAEGKDIEVYNEYIGRFNSEYGMQGMIPMTSIKKFSEEGDWNLDSEIMKLHERHVKGFPLIN